MRDVEPDFWRNLREELAAGRQWVDRSVVLGYAALTGLVVVGFTLLAEATSHGFEQLRSAHAWAPWLMLAWTPLLTVALLWWTRRFVPGAMGSGIPQVVRALDDELTADGRSTLVSPRVSLHKIGLVAGGLLAGLSIGREGPTVQVGAGVMVHARRWLSPQSGIDSHDLVVAGAAAGIAAAFYTPLGGIIFAVEQLSRRRSMSHSALVIVSIVLAGLVAVAFFGNNTYFDELRVQHLSWSLFGPGLLVALVAGLAGGLFSRLVVASARGLPDRFSRFRSAHPLRFAAGCGLAVAVIGLVTGGTTAGAGYGPTRALLTQVGPEAAIPLIALGMVGFLAATTQGPITAFIIVMEMISGHAMVLSLMACSLLASGVAQLITRPMYLELAALLLPAPPAPAAAPVAESDGRKP